MSMSQGRSDGTMKFRFKAFSVHILCSATLLGLILGCLYLGWYHWPGWYLTDAGRVILVMVGVDVVLGPLFTLIVANPRKSRRELTRDIGVIAAVQLCALVYGTMTLWNGRPLYYAFSVNCLQVVQAYDIDPQSADLARRQNLPLAPRWYSEPRWITAQFPKDSKLADQIFQSLMKGGYDIIGLPQYYESWAQGAPDLRKQLQRVGDIRFFSPADKKTLAARMKAQGLATDQADAIALTGRGRSLLAVFDPSNLELRAIIEAT